MTGAGLGDEGVDRLQLMRLRITHIGRIGVGHIKKLDGAVLSRSPLTPHDTALVDSSLHS
jgi:hypothetical protein